LAYKRQGKTKGSANKNKKNNKNKKKNVEPMERGPVNYRAAIFLFR